ncbi:hypothetical protein TNCV_678991 [Trichonephila clavipes]|nr:hypothetical protein TNCV_678991 [Trichonephila clavipes]
MPLGQFGPVALSSNCASLSKALGFQNLHSAEEFFATIITASTAIFTRCSSLDISQYDSELGHIQEHLPEDGEQSPVASYRPRLTFRRLDILENISISLLLSREAIRLADLKFGKHVSFVEQRSDENGFCGNQLWDHSGVMDPSLDFIYAKRVGSQRTFLSPVRRPVPAFQKGTKGRSYRRINDTRPLSFRAPKRVKNIVKCKTSPKVPKEFWIQGPLMTSYDSD